MVTLTLLVPCDCENENAAEPRRDECPVYICVYHDHDKDDDHDDDDDDEDDDDDDTKVMDIREFRDVGLYNNCL